MGTPICQAIDNQLIPCECVDISQAQVLQRRTPFRASIRSLAILTDRPADEPKRAHSAPCIEPATSSDQQPTTERPVSLFGIFSARKKISKFIARCSRKTAFRLIRLWVAIMICVQSQIYLALAGFLCV